jgi:1-aminocyclopropane-1-carboxylate deaminase
MASELSYLATPLLRISSPLIERAGVELLVNREDLNHSFVSGNKWWKLKYNLREAERQQKDTLLTFGGAFSNHIYATAAAAKELGFKSIGVIRGEQPARLSSTLQFAEAQGTHLHFVSREVYREKMESNFIEKLHQRFGDFYCIPEGGTNELAVSGVKEFAQRLCAETEFEYVCCSCGTGGTLAGLIVGMPSKKIIGFSSLRGGFMSEEVKKLVGDGHTNWQVADDYHFGGYAKYTPELLDFIKSFEEEFSIPIEHVYTAKMFYGLFALISKGYFPIGSKILALHTGGLQGRLNQ